MWGRKGAERSERKKGVTDGRAREIAPDFEDRSITTSQLEGDEVS